MGQYFERANNPKRDLGKAMAYYEMAAGIKSLEDCEDEELKVENTYSGTGACLNRYGNSVARFRLGVLYAEGKTIERDLVKSRFWFTAAQEGGLKQASKALEALDDLERRIAARQAEAEGQ